tara:strand:+ start:135 stop:878 length:744 start_codon:yes stop_codon:yes gene_type:complete
MKANYKIALCLSGYIGSTDKFPPNDGRKINLNEGYSYIKKNIIQDYDVDIFVHSWDTEYSDKILKTYNPKSYIIEPQIPKFKIDHTKIDKNSSITAEGKNYSLKDMVFGCQSQKYSRMKVVELKSNYEKDNNFEYDFVFLTRFDLAFLEPFIYENLSREKVYVAGPARNESINEFYYLSNSKNMNFIGDFYNNMESSGMTRMINIHYVEYNYMKNLPIEYLYTRPWGDPKWHGDIRLLRTKPNVGVI